MNFLLFILKNDELDNMIIALGITLIIINFDIIMGSQLMKRSIIGYDPIIGARYYGVGNELMGVLLSTVILLGSIMMENTKKRWYIVILFLLNIMLVGSPQIGSNFGGTISLVFACLYFLFRTFGIKINLRSLFYISTIVTITILITGFFDLYLNPNPSHFGRTINMIGENGFFTIVDIIIRKMKVNFRLIGISIWSKVLYFSLISNILLVIFLKEEIKLFFTRNKCIAFGLISSLVGCITGILLNDSGVLLSALSSIFNTLFLVYIIIDHRQFISS